MHILSTTSSCARPPARADRVLAIAAYLGVLVGLWLIAPIAVYLLRRRHSRFAAHHAAQAALLHLLFAASLTVCLLLAGILGSLAMLVTDQTSNATGVLFIVLLAWCSWLVPAVLHLGLTLFAAWRAYRGRVDQASRLGRWTGWLLAHDDGLPALGAGRGVPSRSDQP